MISGPGSGRKCAQFFEEGGHFLFGGGRWSPSWQTIR
jgi:hypothetical protein